MTVRAKVTRNAFASTNEICAKNRGGGGVKGREGERNRLSIFTEMVPLWFIKQVETFEQTGARNLKATNIYTKGLFNVSHRCYQGPLHLRQHVLQKKNAVFGERVSTKSIYTSHDACLEVFKRFLEKTA